MKTYEIVLSALFVALIAIGAKIQIPVPLVPFTLQFLFTMLAGLLLGARLGSISVASYVFCGLVGLPVFSEGGGPGYIFNPTFGYLVGYALATYATGYFAYKTSNPNYLDLLIANFIGLAILYFCGTIYCYFISNFYLGMPITLHTLFLYCFLLPIPGDIALCFLAAYLVEKMLPHIKLQRR